MADSKRCSVRAVSEGLGFLLYALIPFVVSTHSAGYWEFKVEVICGRSARYNGKIGRLIIRNFEMSSIMVKLCLDAFRSI